MESFESVVALVLEAEGFVVSGAVKFPVTRRTVKAMHKEVQTHGYEVDLVAARADVLVLATVKSFFGSRGVAAEDVAGGGASVLTTSSSTIRSSAMKSSPQRPSATATGKTGCGSGSTPVVSPDRAKASTRRASGRCRASRCSGPRRSRAS